MDRLVKSVSFSKNDLFEMNLLDHAKQNGGFSKYVKRLIQRDMEGGSSQNQPMQQYQMVESNEMNTDFASSFL